MKARYTVQDYMDELMFYGGEWWPRGRVIADLQEIARERGLDPRVVDYYLMGADHAKHGG